MKSAKNSIAVLAACSSLVALAGCSSSSDTSSASKSVSKTSSAATVSSPILGENVGTYQRVTSANGGYSFEIPSSWIYADDKTDPETTAGRDKLRKVNTAFGVPAAQLDREVAKFKEGLDLIASATSKRGTTSDAVVTFRRDDLIALPTRVQLEKQYRSTHRKILSIVTRQSKLGPLEEVETQTTSKGTTFENVDLFLKAPSQKFKQIVISTSDRKVTTDLTQHVVDSLSTAG